VQLRLPPLLAAVLIWLALHLMVSLMRDSWVKPSLGASTKRLFANAGMFLGMEFSSMCSSIVVINFDANFTVMVISPISTLLVLMEL